MDPDDLPLSWGKIGGTDWQDWFCRRCSTCQVCGLAGDIERADASNDKKGEDSDNVSESGDSGKEIKETKSGKMRVKEDISQPKRRRLKCKGCGMTFHSDCLQPSQQKMIKPQGAQWVRYYRKRRNL